MLARAQEKAVYDELCRAELTGYLAGHEAAFDVVVSADTLVYFGALDQVTRAAAAALRPGGWLIFTVEAAGDAGATHDYDLQYHGRYTHTRGYLERVLRQAGFQSEIVRAELRMEGGLPVRGFAVRASRPRAGGGPQQGADDV
jgi:predicted TPR repeat methyltransferase